MQKLFLLSFVAFFMACQKTTPPAPSPTDQLRSEVMEIHDETMKYMTEMRQLRKSLLNSDGSSTAETKQAVSDLLLADSLMMEWMHN
ncbi:MAG: hypothetical protein HKN16_11230, partial [Saprospiraceae bacterium]|nr:hypothetical protein [Saprospiraceae bacterium]